MVFVVNTELNMGVGKVAAQVGHAAVGLYKILSSQSQKYDHMLAQWDDFGSVLRQTCLMMKKKKPQKTGTCTRSNKM